MVEFTYPRRLFSVETVFCWFFGDQCIQMTFERRARGQWNVSIFDHTKIVLNSSWEGTPCQAAADTFLDKYIADMTVETAPDAPVFEEIVPECPDGLGASCGRCKEAETHTPSNPPTDCLNPFCLKDTCSGCAVYTGGAR